MRTCISWVINYLGFYIVWVVCVAAAHLSRPFLAVLVAAGFLLLHLAFVSDDRKKEALFIALLTAYGAVNETLLSFLGAVTYEGALWRGVAWWTLALWASFATTYWHAFSWLNSRPLLAAVLGATVAPICYAWVKSMGAIVYQNGEMRAMIAIALVWAWTLPCTFYMSQLLRRR